MFTTGQKVVCIDDKFPLDILQYYVALPKEGVVYVVRGTTVGISPDGQEGEIAVYLIGLNNPKSSKPPFRERGFKAERFRPLDELKDKTHQDQPEKITVGIAADDSSEESWRPNQN